MDNAATSLPPLSPRDEAVVLQLANELHGIAPLPIASHGECLNISRALLDVGCPSLVALLELPEQPINSVDDLKSYLHNLRYPLGKLQLCRILQWIQQQRLPQFQTWEAKGRTPNRRISRGRTRCTLQLLRRRPTQTRTRCFLLRPHSR
jgi:hypothetical protein